MAAQGAGSGGVRSRRVLIGLFLAAAAVFVVWWLALRPWPFTRTPAPLVSRLDAGYMALVDYRTRIEAGLRLQFLETALVDGRRSAELRPDYRLVEEQLEEILARQDAGDRVLLEAELEGLLPELARDRGAALERMVRIREAIDSQMGLPRQGGDP